MSNMIMKEWSSQCPKCEFKGKVLGWSYNLPFDCPDCGVKMDLVDDRPSNTVMIETDNIPGGIEIKHGLVNEDSSPMKFYSKTEMKREANRRGLVFYGDTPKAYNVSWDGKKKEG